MLSCSCSEYEGEGIAYESPKDFTKLETSKRKRCRSCKKLINIGDPVLEFGRFRAPQTEIEDLIYGEDGEIRLCNRYLCDKCGEIYLNLEDLGYCLDPENNMKEYLLEYQAITGFKSKEKRP